MRRGVFALAIGVTALATTAGGAAPAAAPTGSLSQLAGKPGCVFDTPDPEDDPSPLAGICAEAQGLATPTGIAVSSDGRNVYVAASGDDAIAVFSRNPSTGALTALSGAAGCVAESTDTGCTGAHLLFDVSALAVSPDGRNVYAAGSKGIAVFGRRTDSGALAQLPGTAGCVAGDTADGACTPVTALDDATSVAVSPDGRNVYAGSSSATVAVFARGTTGALSQLGGTAGCLAPLPDDDEDTVEPALPCARTGDLNTPPANSLEDRSPIAVSPDGRNVYVATYGSVATFTRAAASGALMAGGCLARAETAGSGSQCLEGRGLGAPQSIVAGAQTVAVSSAPIIIDVEWDDGIALMRRDLVSGALAQAPGPTGCVTTMGSSGCAIAHGLTGYSSSDFVLDSVALSGDGLSLYVGTTAGSGSGDQSGTILVFALQKGALNQLPGDLGCLGGASGGCAPLRALTGASALGVSPDGRNVYAAGYWDSSVVSLSRTVPTSTLTVRVVGPGAVRSTPAAVLCPKRCVASFPVGSSTTLAATATKSSSFVGWKGACHGKAKTCTVVLDAPRSTTATFRRR